MFAQYCKFPRGSVDKCQGVLQENRGLCNRIEMFANHHTFTTSE